MSAGRPIEWTTEKKDKAIEIYCLKHPITKEIRYIGKSNDSSKRIKSHISSSKIKKHQLING